MFNRCYHDWYQCGRRIVRWRRWTLVRFEYFGWRWVLNRELQRPNRTHLKH